MSFDLRHLRYVLAAAEHRSFFRAALALEIEQSSMSRAIVRLERRLGARLFRRSHAGVSPTPAGAEFIRTARHILAKADQLADVVRSVGEGLTGRLTIGYSNHLTAGHLRDTLLAWRESNPALGVERIEGPREALLGSVDAGVLDVAILAGEAPHPRMRQVVLWSERLMVALPASHPLADRQHLEWTDLADETFLLPADGGTLELPGGFASCIRRAGIIPTIRILQVSAESILSMLAADKGVTLTCECATRYSDLVLRPVHDGSMGQSWIPFSGYWHGDNDNPALRQFLAFVRERNAPI